MLLVSPWKKEVWSWIIIVILIKFVFLEYLHLVSMRRNLLGCRWNFWVFKHELYFRDVYNFLWILDTKVTLDVFQRLISSWSCSITFLSMRCLLRLVLRWRVCTQVFLSWTADPIRSLRSLDVLIISLTSFGVYSLNSLFNIDLAILF